MTITYKTGDLLASDEPVIAHGCNTCGVMGAGIAAQVRAQHRLAYEQYRDACLNGAFPLGAAQPVYVPYDNASRIVYNLGTQRLPGPDATPWGIFLAFANLGEDLALRDRYSVAIPRIGAGIGSLDWDTEVLPAIEEAQARCSRTFNVVVYDLPVVSR